VLKTVKRTLRFMTAIERRKYFTYLGFRSFVALFDLVGILAIGFLATSIALFVTLGSDASRRIQFAGLEIPAVTAQTLPLVAGGILGLFIIKAVLSIVLTRQLAYFLAGIEAKAARTVAFKAFGSGLSEARLTSKDEAYFAIQGGSPAAFNGVLNALGTIVSEGLLFFLVIFSFLFIDPISAFGTIAYFLFIAAIIQTFIGNLLQKASKRVVEGSVAGNTAIGDLSEVLREASVSGLRSIFFDRIYAARVQTASSTASQLTLGGMPRYIVETSLMIAVALFVLWQSANGDIVKAAGTIGIFLSGGLRLTASLLPLQGAFLTVKQSLPIAESALKYLDSFHGSKGIANERVELVRDGSRPAQVDFSQVSFTYPNSSIVQLDGVTFSADAGQQIALIGPSGAGKSTIADLMLGLLEPDNGRIEVNGKSPRDVIRESPGLLAYVPQRPGIISGTIEDNITLGLSTDQRQLDRALEAAHLRSVIDNLPDGIQSNVGKRRDELSGGQLQRIGLARALYSNPGLLVMDEATSALDAESENEINVALDEMRGKVTVVLIAHRLNTIQRSDVVFLVEEGRITASGTFPELLRNNATVQKLASLMSIDSGPEVA
jgi:ABC-type multidrug transport system fused ATPase/permease subunit